MRGELSTSPCRICVTAGSPPHAWGTREECRAICRRKRFTPTCVGNSKNRTEHKIRAAVHPHMRGELHARNRSTSSPVGSPPHAWGTRPVGSYQIRSRRFTPTCVGNSPGSQRKHCETPVHPHMRGELLNPLWIDKGSTQGIAPRLRRAHATVRRGSETETLVRSAHSMPAGMRPLCLL